MAKGIGLLAPTALAGGCAMPTGVSPDATAALPAKVTTDAVTKSDLPEPGGSGTDPVKVALLLPLSGSVQLSVVGKALQQAAELALFERNAEVLQLVVRDDKGTAQGAGEAAMAAIADGAELILGPLLGSSVAAMAPLARQANVPVIAFSNDPANGGRGVHLLSFFAAAETARAIGHAAANGRRHFAALVPDDVLGRDTEPAFRSAVERGGGRVALVERYPADLSGIVAPSLKIAEAIRSSADSDHPIDALFLPSTADSVGKIAATLRHHDIDTSRVKLIVTSGWDNPAALREPKLSGAWLAGPDARGWNEFSARFAKAYKAMPPRLSSLAYDAVTVAAAFATQPKGQRYTAQNLMRESGFVGVDGAFRLNAAGPIERSLAVLEVQPQGLVTIDAGPSFGAAPVGALGSTSPIRG